MLVCSWKGFAAQFLPNLCSSLTTFFTLPKTWQSISDLNRQIFVASSCSLFARHVRWFKLSGCHPNPSISLDGRMYASWQLCWSRGSWRESPSIWARTLLLWKPWLIEYWVLYLRMLFLPSMSRFRATFETIRSGCVSSLTPSNFLSEVVSSIQTKNRQTLTGAKT